jgi:hypothetical protein
VEEDKAEDTSPAERWTLRNVPKERPRTSAANPRCGPKNSGIKLINERVPARKPAFSMVLPYAKQKEFPAM